MSWPTGNIPTTHLDQDTDSPLQARAALKQAVEQVNEMRENGEPAMRGGSASQRFKVATAVDSDEALTKGAFDAGLAAQKIRSGYVGSDGVSGNTLPSGWSAIRLSAGNYRVTHNLNLPTGATGNARMHVMLQAYTTTGSEFSTAVKNSGANFFDAVFAVADTDTDTSFFFFARPLAGQ